MRPLINLRQFLALLVLLIVPAALLTAYFRNYDPSAAGHEHGATSSGGNHTMVTSGTEQPAAGHHAAMSPGTSQKPATGAMNHDTEHGKPAEGQPMDHGAKGGTQPESPTAEQLEASRLQLEASRLQLEASRKQLEAAKDAEAQPSAAPQQMRSPPPQPTPSPAKDGHNHDH